MKAAVKYLLAIAIGLAAVFIGREYLIIKVNIPGVTPPPQAPVSVEPVLTATTIPEDGDESAKAALAGEVNRISGAVDYVLSKDAQPVRPPTQQDLAMMVNHMRARGGVMVDQRMFNTMNECQAALHNVAAQYQQRGVQTGQMIDSFPDWGVYGSVIPFIYGRENFFIGCVRGPQVHWGAYVQYKVAQYRPQR